MERIHVQTTYLKVIHYFFFSLAVFSMSAAIIFWEEFVVESILFLVFTAVYANMSIWIAYFFYKDYKYVLKDIELVKRHAPTYVILGLSIVFASSGLSMLLPSLRGFIYSILFVNYYYIFVIIIGWIFLVIKPVRTLFDFQIQRTLSGGKKIAMKYSRLSEVKRYKIGSNPVIDEILENIWHSKEYPTPHVQRLEIEVARREIQDLEAEIELAKQQKRPKELIDQLERRLELKKNRLSDISSYQD
jgi:cell division protein FtsB